LGGKSFVMIVLDKILGNVSDELFSDSLHDLGHRGEIEYVSLARADTARRRLRIRTDQGTECGIALPRDQKLTNGAVLFLDESRAIVVHVQDESWLTLIPADAEAALELGYHAGNLHWRVRFDGDRLQVPLEGPVDNYLDRIRPLLDSGQVTTQMPKDIE